MCLTDSLFYSLFPNPCVWVISAAVRRILKGYIPVWLICSSMQHLKFTQSSLKSIERCVGRTSINYSVPLFFRAVSSKLFQSRSLCHFPPCTPRRLSYRLFVFFTYCLQCILSIYTLRIGSSFHIVASFRRLVSIMQTLVVYSSCIS